MTRKKLFVALGAAISVGAIATAGFAFWTASGSGTGSSTAATANGALILHASFPDAALYPGDSEVVSFTADNLGAQAVAVGTVHTVVTTSDPLCLASDFSVADVLEGQNIPATTSGVALTTPGSIVMLNTAIDQNACKGATLTLTLSS